MTLRINIECITITYNSILILFFSGMDTNAYEDLCPICDKEIQASEASSILRQKGADGINAASANRGGQHCCDSWSKSTHRLS